MSAAHYPVLEAVCLVIIGQFLVVRLWAAYRAGEGASRVLGRMALLAVASVVAEDSVMHAYGFYQYAQSWWPFVDRLPLLIALIWPVVIHSAWDLARAVLGPSGCRAVPFLGALFVLADAWLIEPIAVRAGLWSWNEPGLFAVPPIGVLGWALFALLAIALLDRAESTGPRWLPWLLPLVAPLGTHGLLLVTWWGAFRWVNVTVPLWPAVLALWVLSLAAMGFALRRGLRHRVPRAQMLARVPAALFFFVLLALYGRESAELVVWALAFAPPYLALTTLRRGKPSA